MEEMKISEKFKDNLKFGAAICGLWLLLGGSCVAQEDRKEKKYKACMAAINNHEYCWLDR